MGFGAAQAVATETGTAGTQYESCNSWACRTECPGFGEVSPVVRASRCSAIAAGDRSFRLKKTPCVMHASLVGLYWVVPRKAHGFDG